MKAKKSTDAQYVGNLYRLAQCRENVTTVEQTFPQPLKGFQIEKQISTYFHFFVSAPIMGELLSGSSPAIIGLLLLKRKSKGIIKQRIYLAILLENLHNIN